jgi:fatty-acyl-CoA synthase
MQTEPLSLATLLRYAATFRSSATVSTWYGGEVRTMTFGQMGARAAQLAHALGDLGVREGTRVATFMWNNNEHQVAYVGVPAMGAILHALNVRLSEDQLIYVANHAEDHVVIVDGSLAPTLTRCLGPLTSVRHVIVANGDPASVAAPPGVEVHHWDKLLNGQPETFDFPVLEETTAAGVCYTSGTTGDPKAVVYSHRSNWLHAMHVSSPVGLGISDRDSVLMVVPMFHANAWGLPYAALMVGTSLVLPDRYLQAGPLLKMMAALKPTVAAGVPTIWTSVLDELKRTPQDISHLRAVIVGGSPLPPSLMRAYEQQHDVRLIHAWGMTELSPLGSVAHPPAEASAAEVWDYRITQGRLSATVQARLVDDDGTVLPNDGVSVGELEVRGPTVTGSYYSPDGVPVDAEAFDNGWLRTGDVGTITNDGYLTLVDRRKDLIKSGGEWISTVQSENLVAEHPAVAEAAVIGVPDERWEERPLVAVTLATGMSVSAAELRTFLTGKIAKWQVPEHWTFMPEIPKTSVGKFDKSALRASHVARELDVVTLARAAER